MSPPRVSYACAYPLFCAKSLVVMKELDGEKEGSKLRGTAVMEQRGLGHIRTKEERFAERVSRR